MNFKELGENLGLDEDEYRELVELFVESGLADYQRLQAAITANDADQIARSAHTIKGAAGNLGLMDVHEVAKKVEAAATDGRSDDLAQAMQSLGSQFDAIEKFVHAG
jgi:histidine phosphotransfer protein HptB